MKRIPFLFVMCFLMGGAIWAQNQYKIQFTYDSAGNQTLRDRVCINCGTSKETQDSTSVEEVALEDDLLNGANPGQGTTTNGTIVAYPNPVTEVLTVEWVENEKQVAQIILFSGIGQQLYKKKINSKYGNTTIDFSIYAPGRYIISVYYTDKTNQSFHILKK